MKRFAAILIAAAMSLVGCSSNKEEKDPAEKVSFPATVETRFGTVTVDEEPKRIVALGQGDAEVALAFGFQPVGASDWSKFGGEGVGPWLAGSYDTAPVILDTYDVDYDDVAALKPDLILDTRGWQDAARYAELSAIAPTVAAAPLDAEFDSAGDMQVMMIGSALGRPGLAEKMIDDSKADIAATVKSHPEWKGKSFSVVTRSDAGWAAYVSGPVVTTLESLGLTTNPALASLPELGSDGASVSISEGGLAVADADVILGFPVQVSDSVITGDPEWNAIPAVADGRAALLDADVQRALELGTPMARKYAVSQIEEILSPRLK